MKIDLAFIFASLSLPPFVGVGAPVILAILHVKIRIMGQFLKPSDQYNTIQDYSPYGYTKQSLPLVYDYSHTANRYL